MNQARNMHTASNPFIKMAPPGWLKYYRDKSHLGRASQPRSCNQGLTMSCNVTQFARDSFVICRLSRERNRLFNICIYQNVPEDPVGK